VGEGVEVAVGVEVGATTVAVAEGVGIAVGDGLQPTSKALRIMIRLKEFRIAVFIFTLSS